MATSVWDFAIAQEGSTETVRESVPEAESGRKILCRTRDSNPRQECAWLFSRTLYQPSYPRPVLMNPCVGGSSCRLIHMLMDPRVDVSHVDRSPYWIPVLMDPHVDGSPCLWIPVLMDPLVEGSPL